MMSAPPKLRVASAQYSVDRVTDVEALAAKLGAWVEGAASAGAKLLVFPEFAGIEFAYLMDRRAPGERRSPMRHKLGPLPVMPQTRRAGPTLEWETTAVQAMLPQYLAIHAQLAAKHRVTIVGGTLPVLVDGGAVHNRAYLFHPDGSATFQDKIVPTRWEREAWGIASSGDLYVSETKFGPLGIAICYDVEFPMVARLQAERGARIIVAPCCCDSLRGYYRVQVGARARALENQAYVIQSPLIGDAPWSAALGTTFGFAGIYGPPDLGPHPTGIIAEGTAETPEWVYADLDLEALDRIRQGAGVIANEGEWTSHLKLVRAVTAQPQAIQTAPAKHAAAV